MLNAKWDSDDGDEAGQSRAQMPDREPQARDQEPQHISDQTNRPCPQIALAGELLSVDGFITEGPERKLADHPAASGPGQTNDRDRTEQRGYPPTQRHHEASEHDLDDVEDGTNHAVSVLRPFKDGRIGYARHRSVSLRCVNKY